MNIEDEVQAIMAKVHGVHDPAQRVMACAEAYDQLTDLIKWLGLYGERGAAAKEAVKLYGSATAAAQRVGLSPGIMQRLARG